MTWIVAGAIGVLIGLVLGVVLWRRQPENPLPEPDPEPAIPPGMSEVINVLRSSAVVLADDGHVLQSTSQARAFGLVRGTRVVVPIVLDMVEQVRADGKIRTADLELRRGRGSTSLFLSARVAPVGDLVLILAEDHTAARRVEDTRRDFVANVSHELKTPIGAITLLAEAVESAADDPEAVRNFAGRMNKESHRLSDLVRQIIELSRLQSDDLLITAADVDVDEMLAEAIDRCSERAAARGVVLAIGGATGCRVLGDAEHLTTAIANLVENAVIYSEAGQKVVVAAHRIADLDERFVEITVTDTGIGISPKELPRIFERFYRVDYARSRDNGGTGLGLAIVKHIVAAHAGQVSVWSQQGQGSTFTVRIPESAMEDSTEDPGDPAAGERTRPIPANSEEVTA